MSTNHPASEQLGFDALIAEADSANARQRFDRDTAHLPSELDEAAGYFRLLIRQHHAAMLEANVRGVFALRSQARALARKLGNGDPGFLANEDAPGCVLERLTAASAGTLPLWGQKAAFEIDVNRMKVCIKLEGLLGIGASVMFWPGFAAHAVDFERPFLSETGYRSFLGIAAEPYACVLPQEFAEKVIAAYVRTELKGKLAPIHQRYRGAA